MLRHFILLLLLIPALVSRAQDTIGPGAVPEADSSRPSAAVREGMAVSQKRDSNVQQRSRPPVAALVDSIGQSIRTDSAVSEPSASTPLKRSINSFTVGRHPSVYGPYAGGFMHTDDRFRVTAPVRRVPELVRRVNGMEWIFYLFCGILLLFSLIRLTFLKYFGNLASIFFNTSIRHKQVNEQLAQSPLPSLLLNFFFFITGGIFIYFILQHYAMDLGMPVGLALLACIAALAVLYGGKYLFISLLGWVFDRRNAAENYLFVVFMVNKVAGFVLLPAAILMAYLDNEGRDVVITLVLIIVFILALIRLFRGYQSVSKILKINPLHFLLYVAAFEVIPVLLIYKVLLAVIG